MQVSSKFFRNAYFIIPEGFHILSSMPVGFPFTEFPLTSFYYAFVYCIYSNKRRGAYLIFRATSAALIRRRRLFD